MHHLSVRSRAGNYTARSSCLTFFRHELLQLRGVNECTCSMYPSYREAGIAVLQQLCTLFQIAGSHFMSQVVKTKVFGLKDVTCSSKGCANSDWLKWKYPILIVILATYYFPRLWCVLESTKTLSICWVLYVSDNSSLCFLVIISEQQTRDFALSSCGVNSEPHNVFHWEV